MSVVGNCVSEQLVRVMLFKVFFRMSMDVVADCLKIVFEAINCFAGSLFE